MRQPIPHVTAQLVGQFRAAALLIARHDERDGNFASGGVRLAHDPAIAHGRMFQQDGLDLGRSDRETFELDHLLAPVNDLIEALLVAHSDVA